MAAEWSRDTPWRQGSLLTDVAVMELGLEHPDHPEDTIVIIATHDCDLAQPVETEPMLEVVVGHCIKRVEDMDGNYTHAKTPRTLHIQFEGDPPLQAEFTSAKKYSISKQALIGFKPRANQHLYPAGQATFQRWLAARYRRSAFPDEFDRRLKSETKLAGKITKAIKPHGKLIIAVLFDVDEGQNHIRSGPDDVYILDITLLYSVEADFNKAEEAACGAQKMIQAAFKHKLFNQKTKIWQSIELRYCDVVSEEALTYRQFSLMKPWRLEHISLGADPQQPIPAE